MTASRMWTPPLVTTAGRMDLVVTKHGVKYLYDVVVSSAVTSDARELARRGKEPGRSLRTAAQRKAAKYGASVVALAIEDTGRVGPGMVRFLSELAKEQDACPASDEYRRLLAEVQHIMLLGTAAMLQRARGIDPKAC